MAKKKVIKNESCCCPSGNIWAKNHKAICLLVLGVLVLLNAIFGWLTWGVFIGGIIALKGLILLLHPNKCM